MSINKRLKKKGFTLIELIIVIAIIAILAAIAIPNFLAIQRKTKVNADIATGKSLYDITTTLIAEGKLKMPEHTGTGNDERWGYGIDLSSSYDQSNLVKAYLQNGELPKPQSVSGGYFYINVQFEYENGKLNLSKPIINVSIINSNNKTVGDVYPTQTGILKLD